AEDGIRADLVTGVQTCALPILPQCDKLKFSRESSSSVVQSSIGDLGNDDVSETFRHDSAEGETKSITLNRPRDVLVGMGLFTFKIGRASCRERGWIGVGGACRE